MLVDRTESEAPVEPETIYTIGHSNHSIGDFLALLKAAGLGAIADVRSAPYSRRNPQFNREALSSALKDNGVAYAWLGEELGARPRDPSLRHSDGGVDFRRLAASAAFRRGIERVRDGARRFKLAIMCAERDPLNCHRTFLIARHLAGEDVAIRHVLGDGQIIEHQEVERRVISNAFPNGHDLFAVSEDVLLNEAYDAWGRKL